MDPSDAGMRGAEIHAAGSRFVDRSGEPPHRHGGHAAYAEEAGEAPRDDGQDASHPWRL